ncbi:unnamed protein product [Cylicostephanus goldi]|uniref:PDZ domain-containing protein n=1 Tax=Cylicostephanus goldi TaxID=71465 RepID=A0A3P6QU61_CYLGO|nr:unnamed protein product [Cylicostephanus goldi]
MLDYPRSPSTSLASSSGRETGSTGKDQGIGAGTSSAERLNESTSSSPRKREGLAARRLIRVPCGTTPSTCGSDSVAESVPIPFTVFGGAAAARLILIDIVKREDLIGILNPNDVILKIEDVNVSGMLRSEVTRLLERLCHDNDQIAVEIVPAGAITDDICEILADKQWAELQTTIRDNLYSKTVPCKLIGSFLKHPESSSHFFALLAEFQMRELFMLASLNSYRLLHDEGSILGANAALLAAAHEAQHPQR